MPDVDFSYTPEEAIKYRELNETTQGIDIHFERAFTNRSIVGHKVLDYGCGMGHLIPMLTSSKVREVIACDPSQAMLDEALEKQRNLVFDTSSTKVTFEQVTFVPLPYETASFDGIVCRYVLHYIVDTEAVLKEFSRVLIPGGWFIAIFSDVHFDRGYEHLKNTELPLRFSNALTVRTLAKPGTEIRENAMRAKFHINQYATYPKEETTVVDPIYQFHDHVHIQNGFLVATKL